MDRITLLENMILDTLKSIDGSIQSTGYTYYSTTGQVDIEDDVYATSKNVSSSDVNHTMISNEAPFENLEWGLAQNIYTNQITYTIHSQIKLDGSQTNTKRSAKTKCNEVLSDLLFAFGITNAQRKLCNFVKVVDSVPMFTTDGSLIKSAKLVTTLELNYSQSMRNPDNIAC